MSAGLVAVTVMDALKASLAARLEESTGPGRPCFVGLYPGPLAVADWCECTSSSRRSGGGGCGMGWVRLDRVYATTDFPTPASKPNCGTSLAAVFEVGVFRCTPTPGPNGAPPDAAELANAALDQALDMGAMVQAMVCCPEVTNRPHVLGTYTPRDGGGCGGGVWPLTVHLLRR